MTTNEELARLDDEVIGNIMLKVLMYRLANPTLPLTQVCRDLELNYNTVYKWISEDRVGTYLGQIHDMRSDMAQIIALDGLPGVVESMIEVAKGERTLRGCNPQAAAEFVLRVAQLGANAEPKQIANLSQVNIYMPSQQALSGQQLDATAQIIEVN